MRDAESYAREFRGRFLEELKKFIRFPSVSSQPNHAKDIMKCAYWLADHMRQIGLKKTRVIATKRHPLVYGEWRHAPGKPTILIYGHFDVQPVDPLEAWKSPPFDPQVRGEHLYGRGSCDDKGQLFLHLKAVEALLKTEGKLPVNVRCLFEGEEEIGSPNLPAFLSRNANELRSDAAVVSDTRMLGPDRPAIHYAERGALSAEIEVAGPAHDLHSGNFGGMVHNPLEALCEMMAKLHDSEGKVAIPGFYDRVLPVSEKERKYMKRTGPKAVIPSHAVAKLNFRLVSAQKPKEIDQLFRRYVERITPPTVKSMVRSEPGAEPVLIHPGQLAIRAAAKAYRRVFGVAPVFLRSGGTIPIVSSFQRLLGVPTVLMGFALPDARLHAPNENLHLPTFERGISTSVWFLRFVADSDLRRSTGNAVATGAFRGLGRHYDH